jgi:hypothetical protein
MHREEARRAREQEETSLPPPVPAPKSAPKVDMAALAREKQKARDWILQYADEESDSDSDGAQVRLSSTGP